MGKRIISQRRGRGGSVFRAPSHRYRCDLKYRRYDEAEKQGVVRGKVVDILHDPGRTAPLLEVLFETGERRYMLAQEGVKVGDVVEEGAQAAVAVGNVLPLGRIPEGTPVCNIELHPGDGGRVVRSAGTYGLVVSHEGDSTVVQLPSGSFKTLSSECRAAIGVVAGGGRRDKPVMKAGKKYHMLRSKAKYWPVVRKVAMNPVDHPFGGGSRSPGKPTTISRRMPPGKKVGQVAARRTGRR